MSKNVNEERLLRPENIKKLTYAYYKDSKFDLFKRSNTCFSTNPINSLNNTLAFKHVYKFEMNNRNRIKPNDLCINKIKLRNKYKDHQISKSSEGFYNSITSIQNLKEKTHKSETGFYERKPIEALIVKKKSSKRDFNLMNKLEKNKHKSKLSNDLEKELRADSYESIRNMQIKSTPIGSAAFIKTKKNTNPVLLNNDNYLQRKPSVHLQPINSNAFLRKRFIDLSFLLNIS